MLRRIRCSFCPECTSLTVLSFKVEIFYSIYPSLKGSYLAKIYSFHKEVKLIVKIYPIFFATPLFLQFNFSGQNSSSYYVKKYSEEVGGILLKLNEIEKKN